MEVFCCFQTRVVGVEIGPDKLTYVFVNEQWSLPDAIHEDN
jgi:hypothetical protein